MTQEEKEKQSAEFVNFLADRINKEGISRVIYEMSRSVKSALDTLMSDPADNDLLEIAKLHDTIAFLDFESIEICRFDQATFKGM